jgi:hypothetical protein
MIKTYGQGGPTGIVAPLTHHAPGVAVIGLALMNGLLASDVARDDEVHRLHLGKGAQNGNLYLASGSKFCFRGRTNGGGYDRVEVLDAPRQGKVIATVTEPKQVPGVIRTIEAAL